jgi:hypothetical protein
LPHELDHIIPEKHRGETRENNLCLACFDCNRHKGSDIASLDPETKQIVRLFNPRADKWPEHFKLNGPTIQPLTPQGRVTCFVLHLNDPERIADRTELMLAGLYPPEMSRFPNQD